MKRDYNIEKSYRKEIDMRTKSIPNKKKYNKKEQRQWKQKMDLKD